LIRKHVFINFIDKRSIYIYIYIFFFFGCVLSETLTDAGDGGQKPSENPPSFQKRTLPISSTSFPPNKQRDGKYREGDINTSETKADSNKNTCGRERIGEDTSSVSSLFFTEVHLDPRTGKLNDRVMPVPTINEKVHSMVVGKDTKNVRTSSISKTFMSAIQTPFTSISDSNYALNGSEGSSNISNLPETIKSVELQNQKEGSPLSFNIPHSDSQLSQMPLSSSSSLSFKTSETRSSDVTVIKHQTSTGVKKEVFSLNITPNMTEVLNPSQKPNKVLFSYLYPSPIATPECFKGIVNDSVMSRTSSYSSKESYMDKNSPDFLECCAKDGNKLGSQQHTHVLLPSPYTQPKYLAPQNLPDPPPPPLVSEYLLPPESPLRSSTSLDVENYHDTGGSSSKLLISQENEIYNSAVDSKSVIKRSVGTSPGPVKGPPFEIISPIESSVEPSNPLSSLSNTSIPASSAMSLSNPLSTSSSSSFSYFSYLPSIPPTPSYASPHISYNTSKFLNPPSSCSISCGSRGSVVTSASCNDERFEKNDLDGKLQTQTVVENHPRSESCDSKGSIRKDGSVNDSTKTQNEKPRSLSITHSDMSFSPTLYNSSGFKPQVSSQLSKKDVGHSSPSSPSSPFPIRLNLSSQDAACSDSQRSACNHHHDCNSDGEQRPFGGSCSGSSKSDCDNGDLFEDGSLKKKKDTYGEIDGNSYQFNYELQKNQNSRSLQNAVSKTPLAAKVAMNVGGLHPSRPSQVIGSVDSSDCSASQMENYNKKYFFIITINFFFFFFFIFL
jgi:hypothetical protein